MWCSFAFRIRQYLFCFLNKLSHWFLVWLEEIILWDDFGYHTLLSKDTHDKFSKERRAVLSRKWDFIHYFYVLCKQACKLHFNWLGLTKLRWIGWELGWFSWGFIVLNKERVKIEMMHYFQLSRHVQRRSSAQGFDLNWSTCPSM